MICICPVELPLRPRHTRLGTHLGGPDASIVRSCNGRIVCELKPRPFLSIHFRPPRKAELAVHRLVEGQHESVEAEIKEERGAGVSLQNAFLDANRMGRFSVQCNNYKVVSVGAPE